MFTDYVLLMFTTAPRRAKAVFNVLRGRRTVSTLFAGLTYGCLDLLDGWHGVALDRFLVAADQLVKDELLTAPREGYLQLTPAGVRRQRELRQTRYWPTAWREFQTADVRRFTQVSRLALQVGSEAVHGQSRYYPVTTNPSIQIRVKKWFRPWAASELGPALYASLHAFLASLTVAQAEVFVRSLTGFEHPGQTDQQLATEQKRLPVEMLVMRKDLMCQWVRWLKAHPQDPLWPLLAPLVKTSAVSKSAQQTYAAFLQHGTLSEIATVRHLKLSTVREHLLEVAILTADFPFARLLSDAQCAQLATIFAADPNIADWQFSTAQAQAPDLDFFEFRLYQIMRCQHA
ncbi:helix-turn-helix domain-containing protein [Lactiplantibacillus modestisalitolerans]|uniref:Helix-turn-helix domain-containing protein n=1 Tax=Lactiplantibacillus modestisalitolerans TaxID=1457219 RepID=A0ABV5WVE8_9LACO|nr:helix-turn-helix domain-containing protein [Lactiplantibacillus modestisalitolerans]